MQQVRAAARGAANAPGFQRLLEIPAAAAGRTKQNHNVLRANRPQAVAIPHRRSLPQHPDDSLRHKGRFLLILVVPGLDHVKLHGGFQRRVGNSLPEFLRFPVGQPADLGAHTGVEHVVHRVDDLGAGTEIVAQENLSSLPRLCLLSRDVFFILFQKNSGVGQTELVDGLLHVADHEAVLLLPGQGVENRVLHAIGVLILVHHDLPVTPPDLPRGGCGLASGFSQQQIQGFVLQISKIQHPAAAFGRGVIPVELPYQRHQPPLGGSCLVQVGQHLSGIVGKARQLLFQPLLAGRPCGLDPIRQLRVRVVFCGKPKRPETELPFCHDIIPDRAGAKLPQLVHGVSQGDGRLFQTGAVVGALGALPKHRDLAVQIFLQIPNQILPPHRLPHVADALSIRVGQAFVQPCLRVQVAVGAVVDLFDDLRHLPV